MILCVDDNPAIVESTQLMLESEGYAVATRTDALRGISAFEYLNPDLVILDYAMPIMNGDDVAAEIRRRDHTVPLILYSGSLDVPERKTRCFDACVAKGDDPKILLHQIRRLLPGGEPAAA